VVNEEANEMMSAPDDSQIEVSRMIKRRSEEIISS